MDELRQANETLDRLTERDVRVVYLPPSAVAAYRYVGDEPETRVNRVIDGFVRESNLDRIKPDLRHFGFNAPNPVDETGFHGYEMLGDCARGHGGAPAADEEAHGGRAVCRAGDSVRHV